MGMPRVKDILLDRELFHVNHDDTVAYVVQCMAEIHVGAILVLDGENLCGIFSERDLMRRVVLEKLDPEVTAVSAVMTSQVATIDEFATIEDAMEAMRVNNCRHLPVTRGTGVVGFLSMRDLMNFELERKTEELHHMRSYIQGA
jgi:CBS domain-containing protein